jgi:hypothetical protein
MSKTTSRKKQQFMCEYCNLPSCKNKRCFRIARSSFLALFSEVPPLIVPQLPGYLWYFDIIKKYNKQELKMFIDHCKLSSTSSHRVHNISEIDDIWKCIDSKMSLSQYTKERKTKMSRNALLQIACQIIHIWHKKKKELEREKKDVCPICLNNLSKSTTKTNCGHTFCSSCYTTYVCTSVSSGRRLTCPCCRQGL